ncbi:hypothetical protein [Alteromonas sp. RKMC-009]|uniref:hypothetical protein n=1 Tax=Alteromonas sp. RKMC-009 TaxID=2267264 RepID=UPI0010C49F50|nr:hypothetical protein [Alteromonas sp. RKMC-009]AYA65033.2 hypothetical protein DS731_13955 [Alteromonas sp. RKMC-009]
MKRQLLVNALALSVLAGCSATPPINEEASAELQAKLNLISLDGTLLKQQDTFILAPNFRADRIEQDGMFDTESWRFNGKTLFPAFKSSRFECSLSKNECEQYEEVDSPFLKVNGTDSDYGDTYEKRVADGKKPGITAIDVALGGATAVIAGPAAVLVGTPLAILGGSVNLVRHGSVWSNNWVEFDHDLFYEQAVVAIQAKHGSLDNYIDYISQASVIHKNLSQQNERLYKDWNTLKNEKSTIISTYHHFELINVDKFTFQIPSFGNIEIVEAEIKSNMDYFYSESEKNLLADYSRKLAQAKEIYVQEQKKSYSLAKNSNSMMDFIRKYEGLDEADLVEKAWLSWRSLVKKEEKIAFGKIVTIRDANNFISRYKDIDEAKLVPKARDLVAQAELRIRNEENEKRRIALSSLNKWRKGLSVGDDTFCGRVIEANYPMFRIALSSPLKGFSDTIWLEKDNLFESWSGCRNINNTVSPITSPLG